MKKFLFLVSGILMPFNYTMAFQNHINSDLPEIKAGSLSLFNKKLSISNDGGNDYYVFSISDIDIDSEENIYVIDYRAQENHVKKFNKLGELIGKYGRKGRGPQELSRPRAISIQNDKLFVLEIPLGMKVFDRSWKYQRTIQFNGLNDEGSHFIHNDFLYYIESTGRFTNHSVIKLNHKTHEKKQLLKFEEPAIIGNGFFSPRSFSVDSNGDFYIAKESEKYTIEKYDNDGELLYTFGREYKRKPLSKAANDYMNEAFGHLYDSGRRKRHHKYPAVIRKILIDENDLLWIIAGEWKLDSRGTVPLKETIDIFTNEGKYLYSFESDYFGPNSKLKKKKLFSIMPVDKETGKQDINIFEIDYSKLIK